jgi:hypothetical protein
LCAIFRKNLLTLGLDLDPKSTKKRLVMDPHEWMRIWNTGHRYDRPCHIPGKLHLLLPAARLPAVHRIWGQATHLPNQIIMWHATHLTNNIQVPQDTSIEILYNRVGTVVFVLYTRMFMHARLSGARSSDEETRTII